MTATLTTTTPIAPARATVVRGPIGITASAHRSSSEAKVIAAETVIPMGTLSPTILRAGMLTIIAAGLIAGFLATGTEASNLAILDDGADLTRLMRFLAAIKLVIAAGAAAAVLWRLGVAISLPRFAAYAVSCATMAAGPGLIWTMSHVGLGALLLHGGLFATVILVWRDPAVAARLADMVAARRRTVATRTG